MKLLPYGVRRSVAWRAVLRTEQSVVKVMLEGRYVYCTMVLVNVCDLDCLKLSLRH
jgi:hypothetical protein